MPSAIAASCGGLSSDGRFWEARHYDFNLCSERERVEKLRYIQRNPVKRAGGEAGGLYLR